MYMKIDSAATKIALGNIMAKISMRSQGKIKSCRKRGCTLGIHPPLIEGLEKNYN